MNVADRLQLVRSVIESLTSAADGARVIVGVDDVHLLDDLSKFLLHQIVVRRAAKLVLTVRDGDPISEATQEIWKAGQFDRLDLRPLSRDESTVLLRRTLDGDVDLEAARRLWKLAELTARAVVFASGDVGRTGEAVAAAYAGYAIAHRSFDAANLRFVIADGHVGALLQSGQVGRAWDIANLVQKQAAEFADSAQPYGAAIIGRTSLSAGRLETACSLLGSAIGSLSASGETFGWRYRSQIPYTTALAMCGMTDRAVTALAAVEELRHPGWRLLDYGCGLARAWVAASRGTISEAISSAWSAAATARDNSQSAPRGVRVSTFRLLLSCPPIGWWCRARGRSRGRPWSSAASSRRCPSDAG